MELRHVRRTGTAIGGFSIDDRETYHISLRVEGVKQYGIERDAEVDRGCYSGRSEGPYELAPAHGAACLLDALGLFFAPSLARRIYMDAGKENFGRDWEVEGCGLAPDLRAPSPRRQEDRRPIVERWAGILLIVDE